MRTSNDGRFDEYSELIGTRTKEVLKAGSDIRKNLLFNEVPSWMQIDPLIRRGYRNELKSVKMCISSLFYTHNEFVNVWSHLLPAVVHLALLAREAWLILQQEVLSEVGPSRSDTAMVQLYVVSAISCLLFSSVYHILSAHSERVAQSLLKLDYLGIVINTAATCITSTWFGLRQEPDLRTIYLTSSIGLSVIVFVLLLKPGADGAAAALWRSILFAAFVGSGYVPMVHKYFDNGVPGLQSFPFVAAVTMAATYFVGVVFYVTRFPESQYPERFDIWGSSHQLFHILVVIGQVLYLRGLRNLLFQIGASA